MTTQATQRKSEQSRIVVAGEETNDEPLRASVRTALRRYFKDLNGHRPAGLYQMVMSEVEQPLLETVMSYTRGNQSQAAAILGINRNTLRKKLKQHGLD
jgi:Fis family transcriptional regulator